MRYIIMLLLLSGALRGTAQVLYVYHFEGNVSISKGKAKAEPVRRGMAIETGTILSIPQDASVHILNEQGLAVLIGKPGKYSYEKILGEVNKSTAVATPFFAHVWKKLREHHGHDPNALGNAPKGGVSRADWVVSVSDTVVVVTNKFVLSWRAISDETFFTLSNASGKKELKLALSDTVVTVFPYEMQLARGEYYRWTLSKDLAGNLGVSGIIYLPTNEWLAAFHKEEEQLRSVLSATHDVEFTAAQLDYFYQSKKIQH